MEPPHQVKRFLLSLDCLRCLFIACSFIWFFPPRIISFL